MGVLGADLGDGFGLFGISLTGLFRASLCSGLPPALTLIPGTPKELKPSLNRAPGTVINSSDKTPPRQHPRGRDRSHPCPGALSAEEFGFFLVMEAAGGFRWMWEG